MLHVGEGLVRCMRVVKYIRFRGSLKRIAIKLSQKDSSLHAIYFQKLLILHLHICILIGFLIWFYLSCRLMTAMPTNTTTQAQQPSLPHGPHVEVMATTADSVS